MLFPRKSAPGESPIRRMYIDFRKLNELQTDVPCAESETGGNISPIPLPKIDEMYGRLKDVKSVHYTGFEKWLLQTLVYQKVQKQKQLYFYSFW